ncbi:unnamed protein product, partial [marine sediment metagenome]
FNLDIGEMRRYIELKKNGVDIWERDSRYAKFIQIFQTGIYPEDMKVTIVATRKTVSGNNELSFPKQDPPWKVLQDWKRRHRGDPSVRSIDYW